MDVLYNLNWRLLIIITSIIVLASLLTPVVRWFIKRAFINNAQEKNIDSTSFRFFMNAASFVIWIIAIGVIVLYIPKLRALAVTLFAGAGIFVAIIGLSAQQAFSNIINGIFIVLFKPFRVGDMIRIGKEEYGLVEDITLRHTVINSFENKRIIIPNSIISSSVIINDSITDSKVCRWIEVGISYDSDIDLAIKIIQEEAVKHKDCIDVRTNKQKAEGEPQVIVRLVSFNDSSMKLKSYVWTGNPMNAFAMHSDINKSIKKRFDEEGVEIPFPYRTIVYKNELTPNTILKKDGKDC